MIPDLQRVLEPAFLARITEVTTPELRQMRSQCNDLENGLSFVRRLAQGRLDLLAAETSRRAEGGSTELADLVARLPELLSDGVRAPGSGRVDQELDPPDEVVQPLVEVLDGLVSPAIITSMPELGDDALSAAIIALRNFEDDMSTSRRSLHHTIDTVNDELARRIADGEPPAATS